MKIWKKILSLILVVSLLSGLLSMTANAENDEEDSMLPLYEDELPEDDTGVVLNDDTREFVPEEEQLAAPMEEQDDEPGSVGITGELESGRGENQKQFHQTDGTGLYAVYPEPVHFDRDGHWEEIDNTLALQDDGSYHNTAGVWDVALPAELNGESPVRVECEGFGLAFALVGELTGEDESTGPEQPEEPRAGNDPQIDPLTAEPEDTAEPAETEQTPEPEEPRVGNDPQIDPLTAEPEDTAKPAETEQARGPELCPVSPVQAQITNGLPEEAAKEASPALLAVEKNYAAAEYPELLPETDLRYDLVSNRLKESVILRSFRGELTGYVFRVDTELTLEQAQDGTILARAESAEEPVLVLPAPVLVDRDGNTTEEIRVELEKTDAGYLLTYQLPLQWMKQAAYPVVLDPVVQVSAAAGSLVDTTVFSPVGGGDGTASHTNLTIGRVSDGRLARVLLKYTELPAMTSSQVIVGAQLSLRPANSAGPYTIQAHRIGESWNRTTLTWNGMPAVDAAVSEYQVASGTGSVTWNITDIAQSWYSGAGNYGVLLRGDEAMENASTGGSITYASAAGGQYAPVLLLEYVDNAGLESWWDYTSQSAGRAGTGYVSNFTGNLVWVHDGLGFPGTRMPAAIQAVYNANDRSSNLFGLGYGWRTNYNQRVYGATSNGEAFIWEDGDGTRHYFAYQSNNTYEDECIPGLILTVSNVGADRYCITDKQGNKSYFDQDGRLTRLSNNQATVSSVTVTYRTDAAFLIKEITDGAGRKYGFVYTSGVLSRINYLGTGTSAVTYLTYTQTDNQLTGIGYKDGKSVTFAYGSGHLLTGATDSSGYKVQYTYAGTPKRVKTVKEYDGSTQGGALTLDYAHNQTTFTDHNGNKEIWQFNRFGSAVSVQDDLGRAQFSQYAGTGNIRSGTRLTLSSKLQDTVVNMTRNGSFEVDGYWSAVSGNAATGAWSYSTAQHYQGARSLLINRTASEGLIRVATTSNSSYTIQPGKTYTASAYVKTENMDGNGNGAYLTIYSSGIKATSASVKTNSGWTRIEATYTNTGTTAMTARIWLYNGTQGDAYFDCVQFEEAPMAGRYNLIENGDFRYAGSSSTAAYKWTAQNCGSSDQRTAAPSGVPAILAGGSSYKLTGATGTAKRVYQTVAVSGSKGDVFALGGWAKGDSVPFSDGRSSFGLRLVFNNTDGTTTPQNLSFNPDMDNTSRWQYAAARAVATKAYSSVTVFLLYEKNCNMVYFDGIELFKEEFGQSYAYDEDGNIVSTTDLQKKTTAYEYASNNLTKITLPTGAEQTYTYDNYHNVKTATSPEGVKTAFVYDTYGNNTKVTVGTGTRKLTATATYTSDKNQLLTVTDTRGKVTTYGYDLTTGVLNWIQEPGQTTAQRTNYTYDDLYRAVSMSQSAANAVASAVGYTYNAKDQLSQVTSASGTAYTMTYGLFDRVTAVKAGTQTLASYTYTNDRNYRLQKLTYGNGNRYTNTYDAYGRVTAKTYGDGTGAEYLYDGAGNLGRVTDTYADSTTKYYYDLQERPVGYDVTGTNAASLRWGYDIRNNLTTQKYTYGGSTYTQKYTYDDDNRVLTATESTRSSAYTYDLMGRIGALVVNKSGEAKVTTAVTYTNPTSSTEMTTSYVATRTNTPTGGSATTYSYVYGTRGNITSLSDGTHTTTYSYDGKGQLLRENNEAAGKTWVYTYDAGGNVLTKKEYAYTTGTLGSVQSSVSYTYGNSQWKDVLTKVGSANITSDGAGNVTGDGTWTYSWTHGRNLISAGKTGVSVSYGYDADGQRQSKTVGSTTYSYNYIGGTLYDMTWGSDKLHFTYDAAGPSSLLYNGTAYYYLRNATGDVVGIINGSGTQVVAYTYDAWGNVLTTTGSMANTLGAYNPLRYRGYVYDTETGLYYLNSRYYNPSWGRFISADSFLSTGQGFDGFNMFAYCNNNPVNCVDDGGDMAVSAKVTDGVSKKPASSYKGKSEKKKPAVSVAHYNEEKKQFFPDKLISFGVRTGAVLSEKLSGSSDAAFEAYATTSIADGSITQGISYNGDSFGAAVDFGFDNAAMSVNFKGNKLELSWDYDEIRITHYTGFNYQTHFASNYVEAYFKRNPVKMLVCLVKDLVTIPSNNKTTPTTPVLF